MNGFGRIFEALVFEPGPMRPVKRNAKENAMTNTKRSSVAMTAVVLFVLCSLFSQAQQTVATNTNVVVPPLVNFSGTLTETNGRLLTSNVAVTFSLYSEQIGGAALWMETQNVQPESQGHYTVVLGSTSSSGLPADIFVAGEAHWLGVQVQGQDEQPRVLLVSAPYALKAGDAQTLGGLPASAFVLAAAPNGAATITAVAASTSAAATPSVSSDTTSDVTTTGGTVLALPVFSTATNIQNSLITQTAKSAINVGGKLNLPATGTATASAGTDSHPQDFIASAFNSGTGTAVAQTFQLQAEPAGNDTATISGTFNLLYSSGTAAPAETGFKISNKGLITFAAGQTFPGTGKGTVTSVDSGAGLTGGPITGSGTLSIATGGVTNTMLANPSITVTAGTDLTGGGSVALGGTTTLNVNTSALNALYPQLAANNIFTGAQTIVNTTIISAANSSGVLQVTNTLTSGSAPAVNATTNSTNASAIRGNAVATTGTSNGVFGNTASPGGAGVLGSNSNSNTGYGVQGTSLDVGVYGASDGQSSTGSTVGNIAGVWGDTGGPSNELYSGIMGTADENYAGFFISNSSSVPTVYMENDAEASSTAIILDTYSPANGDCTINVIGDIDCTGTISGVVSADGGARKVSLYSTQSTENWFEDAGSGQLASGSVHIALDSTFAQTVNTGVEYHVFLTPKGDCEGLYVTNETPQGFDVLELRGGHSAIAFDYRIMAKRAGYENVRLGDLTKRFQMMEKQHQQIRLRKSEFSRARAASALPVSPATRAIAPIAPAGSAAGLIPLQR
jgi:hypothetical protein